MTMGYGSKDTSNGNEEWKESIAMCVLEGERGREGERKRHIFLIDSMQQLTSQFCDVTSTILFSTH